MKTQLNHIETQPVVPMGISSNARKMPDLDSQPFIVESSAGAYINTIDNKAVIDYTMGMGVTVLGHAPGTVMMAMKAAIDKGPMPGFSHATEEAAGAALTANTGSLCHATFVNSGSEAVHLASRLARHVTGKPLVAKVAAGYDGWYDDVSLGTCGSAEAGWQGARPVSNHGITLLRYNDLADAEALFKERDDIAAILVEPLLANAGCIEAQADYLKQLSELAHRNNALVIADEVLAGFRLHPGLTSHKLGFEPDIVTVGKAIGSGFPVAAVLGTSEVFKPFFSQDLGRAGTYNGSPLAAAAVIATMKEVNGGDYARLLGLGKKLREGLVDCFAKEDIAVSTSGFDSVFTMWFSATPPTSYEQALPLAQDDRARKLHLELRRHGVLTMPFPWGRFFVSFAHNEEIIDQTLAAFAKVAANAKKFI